MGGKTSTESKAKYNSKVYDRISVVVKKGVRDAIRQRAEQRSESVNSYICRLIDNDLQDAQK